MSTNDNQSTPRGPVTSSDPAKAALLDAERAQDAKASGSPSLNRCGICDRVGSHLAPEPPEDRKTKGTP